jgi:hypothetical protein
MTTTHTPGSDCNGKGIAGDNGNLSHHESATAAGGTKNSSA